jgi:hypothetical protein
MPVHQATKEEPEAFWGRSAIIFRSSKVKKINDIIKTPQEGKAAISQIERQAMLNSLKASLAKMPTS